MNKETERINLGLRGNRVSTLRRYSVMLFGVCSLRVNIVQWGYLVRSLVPRTQLINGYPTFHVTHFLVNVIAQGAYEE